MLITDGRSPYVIVLPAKASPSQRRAAQELQSGIEQISGARLAIADDVALLPDHAILLGHTRHSDGLVPGVDWAKLGAEGFRLKTAGPHLLVLGSDIRGTLYGTYELLEKLGVRWLTPKVTRIPKAATIALPALDETQVPDFEYREPYFTEALSKEWAAHLRSNGSNAALDDSTGGKIVYGKFVHTFDELIPRDLYKAHPEYFPLIDGKRKDGYVQRCLSNPEVLALATNRARQWIRENPSATIFSVSQNDNGDYCHCDECKAIADKYGGVQSGLYLWFVNQIAESIAKDHPDKLIDTLAYQFTEEPPKRIRPRDNVRVRLCPINVCEAHRYEKCEQDASRDFLDHLKGWSRLTDSLYIWHYNADFAHYLMPFPDFLQFPYTFRLYKNHGVRGIFAEGDYAPGGGGSDAELRAYVMAKLMWNINANPDDLINEWMAGVYGPAAKPMRRWFDLLHDRTRDPKRHLHIFDAPTEHFFNEDLLDKGDKLFKQAIDLTANDPLAREYVEKAHLDLRYVHLMLHPKAGRTLDAFLADVQKFGITHLSESLTVEAWHKRYLRDAEK